MVRVRVTRVDVASHGSEYPYNPHTRLARQLPPGTSPHGGRVGRHSWTNMAEHAQLQILILPWDISGEVESYPEKLSRECRIPGEPWYYTVPDDAVGVSVVVKFSI